jgi:hypothetical protein
MPVQYRSKVCLDKQALGLKMLFCGIDRKGLKDLKWQIKQ